MKLNFVRNREATCDPQNVREWTIATLNRPIADGSIGTITLWKCGEVTFQVDNPDLLVNSEMCEEIWEFIRETKSQYRLGLRSDQVTRDLETVLN